MKILNSNVLICEHVDYENNILNIEGVFTETKAAKNKEILNRPFNIYVDNVYKNDENENDWYNYLFIIMEADIGLNQSRYKLLKEIEITEKMKRTRGVNHIVNIIRFEDRKLLKSPGNYYIKVYATNEELIEDNIPEKLKKLIDSTDKEIIGQQVLVVEP